MTFKIPGPKTNKRAAGATGVSAHTVQKIKKEERGVCDKKGNFFSEIVNKRKYLVRTIKDIDGFDAATIRRGHDFYSRQRSANCVELNSKTGGID
jgi:hypothetical protein